MERTLFSYVWQKTKAQQVWILIVILVSMPINFVLLDLPKYIVNGPIQGKGFDKPEQTQRFLHLTLPSPQWLRESGSLDIFDGFDLDRLWSLYALSGAFLFLVVLSGLFKFYINTYKGRLGERMLGQFRFELLDRVLRFPSSEFRRVKPAEIATMIKDEVEPMGGFIGDAFVQPVFLGGQIITAIFFIMIQNMGLGLITLALLGVQGLLIPRLRRKQLELGRQRQLTARALAGRIGEIVEDIGNIRTNDTANYQRADIASRLNKIFGIRFALYQWKFFIKFLNNFLAQVTPFLFYVVGGFLAIRGTLDIGQLVAVIAAYKDLPSPVKDLIDWDQQRLDVEVKFNQVIEQFTSEAAPLAAVETGGDGPVPHLEGELAVNGLCVIDHSGARLLDGVSFRMPVTEVAAILGPARGGGEAVIDVLARLVPITGGRVLIGGADIRDLPASVTGRRISYVGPDTFFPQSTIADALVYGLRHAPGAREEAGAQGGPRRFNIIEAEGADLDFEADWVDYETARVDGPDGLAARLREVLRIVELEDDLVRLGLNMQLPAVTEPDLLDRLVEARTTFRERLAAENATDLVEPFDPERYSAQATVAENLLFGTARGASFRRETLSSNARVRRIISQDGLDAALFDMGRRAAADLLELFEGLSPDNPLFDQLALMPAEDFPEYRAALSRVGSTAFAAAPEEDKVRFLDVAFAYVEPRERLGHLTPELRDQIVEARKRFRDSLGEDQQEIAFYDPKEFNPAASVQDNILMGRVAFGIADAENRVNALVRAIVDDLNLREIVLDAGLGFNIGTGGKRLSTGQRQKLALGRAILRRPDFLVAHRGLSSLDTQSQLAIIKSVMEEARAEGGFGALVSLDNPRMAEHFDRVIVMEHGSVIEDGPPDTLRATDGHFAKMVA